MATNTELPGLGDSLCYILLYYVFDIDSDAFYVDIHWGYYFVFSNWKTSQIICQKKKIEIMAL